MQCKLQMKTNKTERGTWGVDEFALTEMCFPFLGLGHKYKHKHIILAASLKKT